MVVYVCSCLNVKIFADAIKVQDVNQSSPLGSDVVEIELGDRGFDFKYGFLLKRETVGTWTLFTCVNCKKKTHCINRELKLILVGKDMECGDEVLARLTASPDFSHVFQIILTKKDCFATPVMLFSDPSSRSYDTLQQQLQDVTHHLNLFVLKQETFIEERIRHFEEEQREHLAKIKARALEEKRKMFSLIIQQQSEVQEQSSATRQPQRPRMLTKTLSMVNDTNISKPPLPMSQTASQGRSYPSARQTNVVPDIDSDELFSLDGLEDDDYSAYHSGSSDEEDREVPSVTGRPRSMSSSRPQSDSSLYSASVPVNINRGNHWGGRNTESLVASNDNDDENQPPEFAEIGSRIQALAESINDNSGYMISFERPRPRLNTNNF